MPPPLGRVALRQIRGRLARHLTRGRRSHRTPDGMRGDETYRVSVETIDFPAGSKSAVERTPPRWSVRIDRCPPARPSAALHPVSRPPTACHGTQNTLAIRNPENVGPMSARMVIS